MANGSWLSRFLRPWSRFTVGEIPQTTWETLEIGSGLTLTQDAAKQRAVMTSAAATPSGSTPQPVGTVGAAGASGSVSDAAHVHALAWSTVRGLSLNQSIQINEIDVAAAHVLSLVLDGVLLGTIGTDGTPGHVDCGGLWVFEDSASLAGNVLADVGDPVSATDAVNLQTLEARVKAAQVEYRCVRMPAVPNGGSPLNTSPYPYEWAAPAAGKIDDVFFVADGGTYTGDPTNYWTVGLDRNGGGHGDNGRFRDLNATTDWDLADGVQKRLGTKLAEAPNAGLDGYPVINVGDHFAATLGPTGAPAAFPGGLLFFRFTPT